MKWISCNTIYSPIANNGNNSDPFSFAIFSLVFFPLPRCINVSIQMGYDYETLLSDHCGVAVLEQLEKSFVLSK